MKRLDDDSIEFTQEEADAMAEFIFQTLYNDWDHYTNTFISKKSNDEGMRQMNPTMYDFMEQIRRL